MPRVRRRRSPQARRIGQRIERPPAHWSILALVLLAFVLLLFAQGASTHLTGQAGTPLDSGHAVLKPGQTVLGGRDDRLYSRSRNPGRRVALTFDDGPDPTWTPKIAAELRRLHVPATFFEIGDRVAAHPDITRQLVADGFEIGNHTFTHTDPVGMPEWRLGLEISL